MKNPTLLVLTVQTLLAAGFAPQLEAKTVDSIQKDAERFAARQPEELQPYFKALYVEGEHNAVLNFDRLGLAALEMGDYPIAEHAFDAAITRIEAIYVDNPSAKKARSLFAEERVKDFKGEPYERAMTYYYRGLLYVRAGDFQNARASFLSAEQQSMLSEQESYASTFGLMDYLAGWASHCEGDESRAADLQARAASMQSEVYGALPADVNFVALLDSGSGPVKYGVGKYKEQLAFKPSADAPSVTQAAASGLTLTSPATGADLNYQASTRGGRPVDAILNGKAQWKSGTEAASSAMTKVGYTTTLAGIASNNNNMAAAGEIGMALGLVSGLFSKTMTPAADTRAWTSLPAQIVLVTGTGGPAPVDFKVDGVAQTTPLLALGAKCSLAWGRTQSSSPAQLGVPAALEARHETANSQMRAILESTFVGGTAIAGGGP